MSRHVLTLKRLDDDYTLINDTTGATIPLTSDKYSAHAFAIVIAKEQSAWLYCFTQSRNSPDVWSYDIVRVGAWDESDVKYESMPHVKSSGYAVLLETREINGKLLRTWLRDRYTDVEYRTSSVFQMKVYKTMLGAVAYLKQRPQLADKATIVKVN